MPYAAPTVFPTPITAYPTPPPSPLSDLPSLPEITPDFLWSTKAPISPPTGADPYLTAVTSLPPRAQLRPQLRRSSSSQLYPPSQQYFSVSGDSTPTGSLRLSPPRGILGVLGGVRVLRIDAASVLDRMPYTGFTAASMGLTAAADTDVADAMLASEERSAAAGIAGEAERIDSGVLSLRRAQSESTVHQASTTKTIVPTVALPTVTESPIAIHPPTPPPVADKKAPQTPPLSRSPSGSGSRSPRAPARLLSRPSRIPSSSPNNVTIIPNVLPEVRSPRRNTETLQTRRSGRPRLFGFTGLDSTASSSHTSPEIPSSPVDASSTTNVLPRRNPIRVRSETSLTSLPHASSISPPPRRERRDTGLKLDLGGIVPPPNKDLPLNSGVVNSPYHSVIKKKSGEIVKSALKQGGPLLPNGTPVDKRPYHGSRSCPTTPSCPKYVHFDTQLERVKLFLQDQKPQVVSRQGSPTDELSENEADAEDEGSKKILTIRLPNFPTSQDVDADMFLESLFLNDTRDCLRGVVRVKNIAFEKYVVARFTLDWWNTTSEVAACYKESIRGGLYDRFQFTIKLADLLDTIEEKTLFLCVRYNTGGREIWDSNGGSNYQVLFEKKALVVPKYMPKRCTSVPSGMGKSVKRSGSPWSVTGADNDRMADLRAKLNRLTAEDLELNKPISPKRSYSSPRSSPRASTGRLPSASSTPSEGDTVMRSLAGRYDFGSALKSSRKTSPTMAAKRLPERHAASEFYSPRPGHFALPNVVSSQSPAPSPNGPPSPGVPESPTVAAHGPPSPLPPSLTFASNNSSSSTSLDSVTATPADSPSLSIRHGLHLHDDVTPSDTTNSSESSTASGGSSPMSPTDVFPWSPNGKDRSADDMSLSSYSSFIEQFCWAGGVPGDTQGVRRIHSTSSLDHYFSSPPEAITPRAYTPTAGLSRSTSGTGASATPNALQRRASPPTREDLEHVDNAIRSLSNSLSNTPVSGSPHVSPPMSRMPSGAGTVLAN